MTDTIPMGPDEYPKGGETNVSDSTRKCGRCGEAYTGPVHFPCLAENSTIRVGGGSPPSDPARPRATLDDLPEEAAPHAADPSRLLQHYILVRQVGKGGMGAVWKAWDKKLTRWVAVKFLHEEDPEAVERFGREAKLAARLRHPNIAAIYEVGEAPSREAGQSLRHYLAMEYIDGSTLADAKLDRPAMLELFVKVVRAVDSAHKAGVIHRDLKPPNIMVTRDLWPYVMDFGVAKALAVESSQSVSGTVVGTPAYMPPEQAEGRLSDIDARSDVYALGATLYAVLLGRAPFDGRSVFEVIRKVLTERPPAPREIDPAFPAGLEAVILRAMAKEPKDRYPTAADFADDLARFAGGVPTTALVSTGSSKKGLWVAVVVLLLLAGAAAPFASKFLQKPEPPKPPQAQLPEKAPVVVEPPRFRPSEFPPEAGLFTLRIAVHPFAQVVSVTRNGAPVAVDQPDTPLEVRDLRIGSYELQLRHPKFGDRTVKISEEKLKAGKTYEIWGRMENPALALRELP